MAKIETYCSDCIEAMRSMRKNQFDLAIVDPNQGQGNHGGKSSNHQALQRNGKRKLVVGPAYEKKDWDICSPPPEYFKELFRISKNQIIWGAQYFPQFGSGRVVWDKVNHNSDQYDCEIAYQSLSNRVELIRYMWVGMMQGKSLSQGDIVQGNKKLNEKRIHPTQKPVLLYRWLLSKFASTGDKIIDTHFGSLSIGIACYDLGFDLTAFESCPAYYKSGVARLNQHRRILKLDLS